MDEADDEPTGSSAAMPSMSAPSMKEKEGASIVFGEKQKQ